jgi:hypothetical protein
MPHQRFGAQNSVCEWAFTSSKTYTDPFNDVELDVVFTGPDGRRLAVPAYWAGEQEWRVRFAPPEPGVYSYKTVCTDSTNPDLHGQPGTLTARPCESDNPLFRRGRLRVSASRRHLEHSDATPFFWLADTWWMGLCKRLSWPGDFQQLTDDRVRKGFTVIQIIAGLYPDMPAFDERGANETGFPWEKDYARIVPAYFDMADLRIQWLVRCGLVPCIVGFWGYFLPWMGVDKSKRHWRNLVARYAAYPVAWCLAGEGVMPYYLSTTGEQDAKFQKKALTELAAYVRRIDPFRNPLTIHPTNKGKDQLEDPSLLDFEMLQTGHSDRQSLPSTISTVADEVNRQPIMPVINGEVCYEGIGEACRQEVQRLMFWASVLNGTAGHTYGANGIWQINTREKVYGPSPHGRSWGNTPWEDAYQLPGSKQLGLSKRLLERYAWWKFEPHPEWVDPRWTKENYFAPMAAGIPRVVRVIYVPLCWNAPTIKGLEPGTNYRAYIVNPVDGAETKLGPVAPSPNGDYILSAGKGTSRILPIFQDWLIVLETAEASR